MSKGSVAVLQCMVSAMLLALTWGATETTAQTSPEQCALDSLVLLSPEENNVSVRLAVSGERFGSFIYWEEPPRENSTCATIRRQDLLPLPVELTGTYLDQVDRELEFFTVGSGAVGGSTVSRLQVNWFNVFVSRSGSIGGQINLSNNGGVLQFRSGNNTWQQFNAGFPRYLASTDILAIAQSPQDPTHLVSHLGSQGFAVPTGGTRGLWERSGESGWRRIAEDLFPDGVIITQIAFSPDSDEAYLVGSKNRGLFVTRDGGVTFQQWTNNLDPTAPSLPNYEVTAVTWEPGGTIYVAIRGFDLFVSRDNGQNFQRLPNLRVRQDLQNPASPLVFPRVNQILVDPTDADHILVAIDNYALYHSTSGGSNWSSLTASWILATDPNWRHNGVAVDLDPIDDQLIIVGTSQKGFWRTADGGTSWVRVAENVYGQDVSLTKPVRNLYFDPARSGGVIAFVDKLGFLISNDSGVTWGIFNYQPNNINAKEFYLHPDGNGDMLLASYAGGIYIPGTPIPLSDTITSPGFEDLDLGLAITFGEGNLTAGLTFRIVCQDFQGYAVWRSESDDPFRMQLIGLYDKTNPETCIEGFCGDLNFNILPNCFSEKRAACFNFDPSGGSVEFFDDTIYNGFTYFYAVTTFDYLNTAGVEPTALAQELLISPRYPSEFTDDLAGLPPGEDPLEPKDPNSPFWGRGNLVPFQVNLAAQPAKDGPDIYVFPNPLRNDVGFPGQEGNEVVFTNLPPESIIQVFTTDGDIVAELGPDQQVDANIYWSTVSESNEPLASGIYLWRVQMPERGDYWGKLIIIR